MGSFMIIIYFAVFAYAIIHAIIKSAGRRGNRNIDKYRTINSHYSQSTLNPTAKAQPKTKVIDMSDHNHAYEHKVEPIEEATVMDMFDDRKEAYREKKKQMKANLHKSSYSETQNQIKQSAGTKYRNIHRPYGKNGDNGERPAAGEIAHKCQYCGAVNIIPASGNQRYSCYFCRQEI